MYQRTHINTHTVRCESVFPQTSFELSTGIYSVNRQANKKKDRKCQRRMKSLGKRGSEERLSAGLVQDSSEMPRRRKRLPRGTEVQERVEEYLTEQSNALGVKKGHLSLRPPELFPCFPGGTDR